MVSSYLRGGVADADGSTATVGDGVAAKISFLAPDSKRGMAMPMPFTSRGSLTCAMRRTSNVEQVTGRVLIRGCLCGRKIEIALRSLKRTARRQQGTTHKLRRRSKPVVVSRGASRSKFR